MTSLEFAVSVCIFQFTF